MLLLSSHYFRFPYFVAFFLSCIYSTFRSNRVIYCTSLYIVPLWYWIYFFYLVLQNFEIEWKVVYGMDEWKHKLNFLIQSLEDQTQTQGGYFFCLDGFHYCPQFSFKKNFSFCTMKNKSQHDQLITKMFLLVHVSNLISNLSVNSNTGEVKLLVLPLLSKCTR